MANSNSNFIYSLVITTFFTKLLYHFSVDQLYSLANDFFVNLNSLMKRLLNDFH